LAGCERKAIFRAERLVSTEKRIYEEEKGKSENFMDGWSFGNVEREGLEWSL
jgi:hypothetical protein